MSGELGLSTREELSVESFTVQMDPHWMLWKTIKG